MIEDEDAAERHKKQCYESWKRYASQRRGIALDIFYGRMEMDEEWPIWIQRDITAEINRLFKD